MRAGPSGGSARLVIRHAPSTRWEVGAASCAQFLQGAGWPADLMRTPISLSQTSSAQVGRVPVAFISEGNGFQRCSKRLSYSQDPLLDPTDVDRSQISPAGRG